MIKGLIIGGIICGVIGFANLSSASDLSERGNSNSQIQLIRNATMKFTYAGKVFLTDPMLSKKGEIQSFAGIASNPTVELPLSMEEILSGVDAVIVSHLHPDHFHKVSDQKSLHEKQLFCQPEDEAGIRRTGFPSVTPIADKIPWEGITITRVGGEHGKGEILAKMGNVSGFVFQAINEPTVYWAGDTIWCKKVEDVIEKYKPEIIITHSGGATIPGFSPILMDIQQTIKTLKASPDAVVVAIHLESLDHCTVSRKDLRKQLNAARIDNSRFLIPADGEIIKLSKSSL